MKELAILKINGSRSGNNGSYVPLNEYVELQAKFDKLKSQSDALAAENAALKELYRQSVKDLDDTCFEIGMMRGEKSMEYPAPETPVTDAYLNSVRAEGVDYVAEAIGAKCAELKVGSKDWKELKSIVFMLGDFSSKLRAGEPS